MSLAAVCGLLVTCCPKEIVAVPALVVLTLRRHPATIPYTTMTATIMELYEQLLAWAKEDLSRPVLILVCGMLLFNLPTLIYKIRMVWRSFVYFFFCWDKSWKKPQDPGAIFGPHLSQGLPVERKTIYFCRHTESTWNDTFNKGKHRSAIIFVLGFIPGLIKAILYELYLLLSGKLDRCVLACLRACVACGIDVIMLSEGGRIVW